MKSVFFCYNDQTYMMDKFIDQIHLGTLGSFIIIVFLDWPYWKAAPYNVHSSILHGIVLTFLFLRFCKSLDFQRVIREFSFAPRFICALLSGINAILTNIQLVKCSANYPDFLKLAYYVLALIVVVTGYLQLVYFIYAMAKIFIIKPSRMAHHEMQDEPDYKNSRSGGGGPIKSHLKEQKGNSEMRQDGYK